jgi:AcrR family transcriptional regulator
MRARIVERAAGMLRAREPVTLRSLVAGTGASTMAVYTYFDSLDGVWRAVRQEGFTRLAAQLDLVHVTDDPVGDLTEQLSGYLQYALDEPDLYRVMFDVHADLEDAQAADATLGRVVETVRRCQAAGRLDSRSDALDTATKCWVLMHGIASLVATGPLALHQLEHAPAMIHAQLVGFGGEPDLCRTSISARWHHRELGRSGPTIPTTR